MKMTKMNFNLNKAQFSKMTNKVTKIAKKETILLQIYFINPLHSITKEKATK